MKITKEYRWLLFLLVPLIILMIILILISAQFVFFSKIFSTHSYNLAKNINSEILLQSQGKLISLKINSVINHYNQILNYFDQSGFKNYYDNNQIQLNNAYRFYGQYGNSSAVDYKSMWFLSNKSSTKEFTPLENAIYQQYIITYPLMKVSVDHLLEVNQSFISGIFTFIQENSTKMLFYYPSLPMKLLSNLSTQIDQSVFDNMLNIYAKTNNTFMFLSDFYQQYNITAYCKLNFNEQRQPKGCSCIDFDIEKFINYLKNDFSPLLNSFFGINFVLATPYYEGIQEITTINKQSDQNYQYDMMPFKFLPLVGQKATQLGINFFRMNSQHFVIYPIILSDYFTLQDNIVFYMMLQVDLKELTGNVQLDIVIHSLVNTIIPISILLLITLIISIFILKSLLRTLDIQLCKINEYCEFIFNGDLQIQIPDYSGTKDIVQIYQCAKIINKLHKYSSNDYFVGHFSNRILKYNEALHYIQELKYDANFVKENIGEAYTYIDQYEKSIKYLKESAQSQEKLMKSKYNKGLSQVLEQKERKGRLSKKEYKQDEIILIRRLWKLVYCYFRQIELREMMLGPNEGSQLGQEQRALEKQELMREALVYITKLKMTIYPDFKSFAEAIWLFNFQIKFYINNQQYEFARSCLQKCQKIALSYAKQYEINTKKIKEKGSKNLFFYRKNKLSNLSRSHPQIVIAFTQYSKALIAISDPNISDDYTAFSDLINALKTNIYSNTINYLIVDQIKDMLDRLDISTQALQSTQLFKQSMPYKTLFYGEVTESIERSLYRFPKNAQEIQCRQFVILMDSSYIFLQQSELRKQKRFYRQKMTYLYKKFVKPKDRLSLLKCNTQIGLETMCNLLPVQHNGQLLKKSLSDMITQSTFHGKNYLSSSIQKIFYRIKKLKCQKVVCIHLKNIYSYAKQTQYQGKLIENKKLIKKLNFLSPTDQKPKEILFQFVGEAIEKAMKDEQLRNCKLILIGSLNDSRDALINFFGLKDINKKICSHHNNINTNNNLVYIIEQKYKTDLDRILQSKIPLVPDNHVFTI